MAGDSFRKVRPREPLRIPAAAYNAFIDAARAHRGAPHDADRIVTSDRDVLRAALTPVRNGTGSTIPRFGVMGVEAPLFDAVEAPDAFRQRLALRGVAPSVEAHTGKFVI